MTIPLLEQVGDDARGRKRNGVFYTPEAATSILCKWAIRSQHDVILEPSFGGCRFLEDSAGRLAELGAKAPLSCLYGCDLDGAAFQHLKQAFGNMHINRCFLQADFLSLQPSDFGRGGFDVVIGNPPYVSHHNMTAVQKESVKKLAKSTSIEYDKSSLWAYFVRHSLSFLRESGRAAWILPGSFLFAEYARPVRELLRAKFARTAVLQLGQRLFIETGAEEQTVVVLCDGYKTSGIGTFQFGYVNDLAELASVVASWDARVWSGASFDGRPGMHLLGVAQDVFAKLESHSDTRTLGEVCKLQIGLVTGANRFFVLSPSAATKAGLSDDAVTFTLSKFAHGGGLTLGIEDHNRIRNADLRCLLVDTRRIGATSEVMRQYLETFPIEARESNQTFHKRRVWHQPNDGRACPKRSGK